jgi:hypothetical protein
MNHYTLHSLDTQTEQALILETADKKLIRAPTADDLGRKLAETEHATPNIRLDNHCEHYLPADVVQHIMSAYDRAKAHEQVKAQ